MFRVISTFAIQIYNIFKRNANALTLVNTIIICSFFAFFAVETIRVWGPQKCGCLFRHPDNFPLVILLLKHNLVARQFKNPHGVGKGLLVIVSDTFPHKHERISA